MIRSPIFAVPLSLTCLAWAALATAQDLPQGQIGTIERGHYVCEVPGSATDAASIPQPDANFTIDNSSRYSTAQGNGTYLRRGNRMTFTSGPRQGEEYRVISGTFLRRLENGQPGRLRCVRSGR